MFDIITIGSAVQDIFLRSRGIKVIKSSLFKTGRAECLALGSKVGVEEMHFSCGGSAVNTAITFSHQGFKVAALLAVGEDLVGQTILRELKKTGIDTSLAQKVKSCPTAHSIILSAPTGERTILAYRGANDYLKEPNWSELKTQWLYLGHLAGSSAVFFASLLDFAQKNKIKVALNPGKTQLEMGQKLTPLLKKVDVLILNQEEASYLTNVAYQKEKEIFRKLDLWVPGLVVMTEGKQGAMVSDGRTCFKVGALKPSKMIDKTGAGDAFGSGFVSALIKKKVERRNGVLQVPDKTIEYALQMASANAVSVLGEWGANQGLLKKRESIYRLGKIKILKKPAT